MRGMADKKVQAREQCSRLPAGRMGGKKVKVLLLEPVEKRRGAKSHRSHERPRSCSLQNIILFSRDAWYPDAAPPLGVVS